MVLLWSQTFFDLRVFTNINDWINTHQPKKYGSIDMGKHMKETSVGMDLLRGK